MIILVVATDRHQLIGSSSTGNGIPWHVKEDFMHFRSLTMGQTIVMGENTFKAIGKPLPQRKTIVCSQSDFTYEHENVEIRHDLFALIKEYREKNEDLYICGGATIYRLALPYVDKMYISRIPGDYEGDTYFPDFSSMDFHLESQEDRGTFTLEIYTRGSSC